MAHDLPSQHSSEGSASSSPDRAPEASQDSAQSLILPDHSESWCPNKRSESWFDDAVLALALYSVTTAVLLFAVLVAAPKWIEPCDEFDAADFSDLRRLAAWDGIWYMRIVSDGYSYDAERSSSVAFFPAYPLAARTVMLVTGLPAEASLLAVSHGSLILALLFLFRYVRLRFQEAPPSVWCYSVISAAVFPTTFYWRMAYTESLFVLLAVVVLYGIERGWKPLYVALWIGLATATRLTGIALFVPLTYDVWRKHSPREALRKLAALAPVSIWGLGLYVGYQAWEFGEPLAFKQTQVHWQEREMPDGFSAIVADYLTFEPIRGVYRPECECYWANDPPRNSAALSLQFMNPVYVLLTAGLVAVGWGRGWLNRKEVLLSIVLVLIAYVLQGYRTCMVSQARYVSVAFPQYIVVGHLLARLPTLVSVVLLVASGAILATYAAMFTSWYWYY